MNTKRILSCLVTISILLSVISIITVPVNALEYCYAAYGVPTIDGIKDAKYDGSSMIRVGDPSIVFATVWTLWDEKNIYVFSQVYDKTVVDTPSSTTQGWLSDSIEIFIDRNNAKTAPYQEDDLQVTIDVTGNINGQNLKGYGELQIGDDLDGVKFATKRTSYGYTIEESIPLEIITGADGKKIGFDIGINNANLPGVRANYLTWAGGGNGGTNGWNTLVMMTTVPDNFKQSEVSQRLIEKGENVALFAFASMNIPAGYGNVPFYAVDGNDASYTQATDNSKWVLQVDLGNEIAVDKFSLKMNNSSYMSTFYFEYSTDNFFWVKLDDKLFEAASPPDSYINYQFDEANMRYIRLVPETIIGGGELYGHAIHELKVFSSKSQTIILPAKLDDRGAMRFTYSEITKGIMENNSARYDLTRNGAVKDLYAIYLANYKKNSENSGNTNSSNDESSQQTESEAVSIGNSSLQSSDVISKGSSSSPEDEVQGSDNTYIYVLLFILLAALLSQIFYLLNRKFKFIRLKK